VGLLICLAGCDSGNSGGGKSAESAAPVSPLDVDLTGTWISINEDRTYKTDTDEYLFSSFSEGRFVLEDTAQGIRIDRCEQYGSIHSNYGVKTEKRVYLVINEGGYILQSDGSLTRTFRYESEWEPGFYFNKTSTFRRLSRGVEVNSGMFILRGPINIEQQTHVCVRKTYYNYGNRREFALTIPFDNEALDLSLTFVGEISEGRYTYEDYRTAEAVRIDIHSSANQFNEVVESNTLDPRDVTINITEFSDERLSGTFSLTGQDDGLYSGEFDMFLNDEIFDVSP